MASRRMFSKVITGSARFLRMPAPSRLLYYDLGMEADDDGFVEAFTVLRTSGASEDDLKALQEKGFVRILNEDLVTYIIDWKTNNYIQSDRYRESIYHHFLDTLCIHPVSTTDTQDRLELGKGSLSEDKIEKENLVQESQGQGYGGKRGKTNPLKPLDGVSDAEAEFEKVRQRKIQELMSAQDR